MYKDTLKGASAADSRKEVEFENLDNYVLVRDRAKRTTTIPARYRDEGNISLPRSSGSKKQDDMATYAFAIAEEEDIHQPITFHEAINSSEKEGIEGVQKPRYKARLAARGFVVRHTSIRVILSLTACEDYELEQLN
ncbi:hypothetical protein Tco_1276471 [Tanacetum coccineum]